MTSIQPTSFVVDNICVPVRQLLWQLVALQQHAVNVFVCSVRFLCKKSSGGHDSMHRSRLNAPPVATQCETAKEKSTFAAAASGVAGSGMDDLIALVNKLQNHVSKAGMPPMAFNLPQIVVVGSQSAGKSSVLENFVGRSFLPRGANIVTRCPLVLQMEYDKHQEYGEFSDDMGREFTDFTEIRGEIQRRTDFMAPGSSISPTAINLRIRSPHVLNLTLVDLPGLTLVPTVGQPDDIEQQIRDIVMQYARESNALILAVSPANVDLANSAALKLAKEVDPQGLRTISVITKVDLMPADANPYDIFSNKLLQLKLGHWGVVNTSRGEEKYFFEKRATYYRDHEIARQCGTANLQTALVAQLRIHIENSLPGLRDNLRRKLAEMGPECDEHREYEAASAKDALVSKYKELTGIMQHLASAFECSIEALSGVATSTSERHTNCSLTTTLNVGARISNVFHDDFYNNLAKIISDIERDAGGKLEEEIGNAIRNNHGIRSIVFPHQKAFEDVTRARIRLMHGPCMRCLDDVVRDLQKTFAHLLDAPACNVGRYLTLRNEIQRRFETYLSERQNATRILIHQFVECQAIYFNTNHKDFVKVEDIILEETEKEDDDPINSLPIPDFYIGSGDGKLGRKISTTPAGFAALAVRIAKKNKANATSPISASHIHKVRVMMRSYINMIKWNLYDNVPKYIVNLLIYDVIRYLQIDLKSELLAAVTKEHYARKKIGSKDEGNAEYDDNNNLILHLMEERLDVVEKRKDALRLHEATKKALAIVDTALSSH